MSCHAGILQIMSQDSTHEALTRWKCHWDYVNIHKFLIVFDQTFAKYNNIKIVKLIYILKNTQNNDFIDIRLLNLNLKRIERLSNKQKELGSYCNMRWERGR